MVRVYALPQWNRGRIPIVNCLSQQCRDKVYVPCHNGLALINISFRIHIKPSAFGNKKPSGINILFHMGVKCFRYAGFGRWPENIHQTLLSARSNNIGSLLYYH